MFNRKFEELAAIEKGNPAAKDKEEGKNFHCGVFKSDYIQNYFKK
jgi:hypothetical protein